MELTEKKDQGVNLVRPEAQDLQVPRDPPAPVEAQAALVLEENPVHRDHLDLVEKLARRVMMELLVSQDHQECQESPENEEAVELMDSPDHTDSPEKEAAPAHKVYLVE